MTLRFGHPEDKRAAIEYEKRSAQRSRLRDNVVFYYRQYVAPAFWPTENAPHCFYPKSFNRVPLSVLQEAARSLQILKQGGRLD